MIRLLKDTAVCLAPLVGPRRCLRDRATETACSPFRLAQNSEHLVERERERPETSTGGVEDRVADGGRCADHRHLADSFGTDRTEPRVVLLEELDLDLRNVCVCCDVVAGEVAVNDVP